MIQLIGGQLYRWGVNRKVEIKDITQDKIPDKILFANKGDSVAVKMDYVATGVEIPAYLLQTGKPVCVYLVKDNRTVEHKIFPVYDQPRPEDYIYENDQRNYVYELTEEAKAATKSANAAATLAYAAQEAANEAAEDARKAAAELGSIIDDGKTDYDSVWSSQKVSDLFTITRELIETGDEKVALESQLYVSQAITDESSRLEALMDSKDQQAALEMEMKMAADGVNASILKLGNDTSSAVVVSADSREDGFGVLRLDPLMEKPFPERDKNRVILRNIAPGTADDDAATVWQTKQIANSLIENTRTVVSEAEEKLREEMSEKRALHASTLRVGDTVLGDVLIQTGANEADSGGNLAGVLNLRPYAYQGNKVILRNIAPGTQENDAVTKGQMDRAFGDLESALDAIIAIQNGLLRFSFYVSAIEYFAEPGMTWREWMDSEYNDGSFSVGYIEDGDVAFEFVMIDETEVYWDGKLVPLDDRIIENGNYSV